MLGINVGMLMVQLLFVAVMLALPVFTLLDLRKQKLESLALAVWVLVICAVPFLGAIAYWIIRPSKEEK